MAQLDSVSAHRVLRRVMAANRDYLLQGKTQGVRIHVRGGIASLGLQSRPEDVARALERWHDAGLIGVRHERPAPGIPAELVISVPEASPLHHHAAAKMKKGPARQLVPMPYWPIQQPPRGRAAAAKLSLTLATLAYLRENARYEEPGSYRIPRADIHVIGRRVGLNRRQAIEFWMEWVCEELFAGRPSGLVVDEIPCRLPLDSPFVYALAEEQGRSKQASQRAKRRWNKQNA